MEKNQHIQNCYAGRLLVVAGVTTNFLFEIKHLDAKLLEALVVVVPQVCRRHRQVDAMVTDVLHHRSGQDICQVNQMT